MTPKTKGVTTPDSRRSIRRRDGLAVAKLTPSLSSSYQINSYTMDNSVQLTKIDLHTVKVFSVSFNRRGSELLFRQWIPTFKLCSEFVPIMSPSETLFAAATNACPLFECLRNRNQQLLIGEFMKPRLV
jgi:hypothetical protein